MVDDNIFAEPIEARRDALAAAIPRHYHPVVYFGAANLIAAVAIAGAVALLHDVMAWEWLIVPGAFLVANWVEYRVHKGPMHQRRPPWQILFERHTRQHHVYFDDTHMSARSDREYYWVFFPWWAVGLVVITAALFALPLAMTVSRNAALLFFATAIGYYLTYEWLHFSYHLHPQSVIGRLGIVRFLRKLHSVHHHPGWMTRHNFNITFPICDWCFNTLHRAAENCSQPAAQSRKID